MSVIIAEEMKNDLLEQLKITVDKHDKEIDLIDNELDEHYNKIEELKKTINNYDSYFHYAIIFFTLFILFISFIINSTINYEFHCQVNFILTILSSFTICQLFNKFFLKWFFT